jgi:nitrogen fixation/metabolism regulation signal transduction histidine kinase
MDSDVARSERATFAITWRAALLAGLTYLAIHLALSTRLYATIACVIGLAAVMVVDVRRIIKNLPRRGAPDPLLADSRARIEWQRQLEILQTLLDTVAAVLIVVGADGRITLANRAARTLAGRAVTRLEEIGSLGESAGQRLLGLPSGAREIVRLADGSRMLVSVSRFTPGDQQPRRLISLQRIAGELDRVELEAWQEMARVLAHEMMNSLTPIASLAESLAGLMQRAGTASGEVGNALEIIRRRSLGLVDFVERYRAVAELPAPRLGRVDVPRFLTNIQGLFEPEFAAHGITYATVIEPDTAFLVADAHLLEQAVINLLRNAVESVSGTPGPVIRLAYRRREEWLAIEIADTGHGVSESLRERVFVPFFTTKVGGSGVGLNLTRQIALSHGGRLELRPNQPQGAIFTLLLPVMAHD